MKINYHIVQTIIDDNQMKTTVWRTSNEDDNDETTTFKIQKKPKNKI